ncbi:MAG: DUF971 domain-containing protein [Ignavibacteria bacterium]|nr:DUF971 domain-containing protein [Ignavibacteria bacterium]MBT8381616.1 DUF971 domain-containing protein [Ignavibacteria bacterium]MBT8391605.1 DUF971 domain-containing protein [Ignavibacteria bacterium]NNJ53738.1 DUF971 domain-containing protein [Ignavibacteriaceae bacterium]NNL21529.1 DUF971 domain-containing protein [Ignavibacteriaceae bacterium]
MNPKSINVKVKKILSVIWEDDSESKLQLKYMRDQCPCATCKGETVLLKTYRPPAKTIITPEMYQVKNIETVGGYAIQITWADGHNTGIYSWEYLLELIEGQSANNGEGKEQSYNDLL